MLFITIYFINTLCSSFVRKILTILVVALPDKHISFKWKTQEAFILLIHIYILGEDNILLWNKFYLSKTDFINWMYGKMYNNS